MRHARPSRVVPWLLIVVIALIVYGSLYPFDFRSDAVEGGLLAALGSLSWARAGIGDRVSNVLLYVPLGFCAFLLLEARTARWRAGMLALAAGTALSLVCEIAQVYVSPRVPSLMDLMLNALGTLAGAIAGVAWRSLGGFVYVPARTARSGAAAIAVLVSWVALRLAPFSFEIDLGKLKAALAPLVRPDLGALATIRHLVSWLVVAQALFATAGRERGLDALLGLIAVVLVARLLVTNQTLVPSELLALLLLLPGLVLLSGMRRGPRSVLLSVAIVALLCVLELTPFAMSRQSHAFDLWPFLGWIRAGYPIDELWILERLFLYTSLLWLLREGGLGPVGAGAGLTSVVLAIEFAQIWQVDGTPSLTRPALAVALAVALAAFERPRRRFG
jgi:VanZ family protein